MRVARLTSIQMFSIAEEDFCEKPAKGEAVVQVKAVGVCGTDLHIFNEGRADVVLPRIMGHELTGIVTEVGECVENVKPGDRVCMDPVVSCGKCALCKSGHSNICANVKCFGVQMDGGYRDFIVADAGKLYVFPDKYTFEEAALAEPFSIAAQILDRCRLKHDEKIVIIGAGTIGLCVAQAAKGIGAKVLISDVVQEKLDLAASFHCDYIVNSREEDIGEAIARFAEGKLDVIVDCVGVSPLLEEAIKHTTPLTRICCIGFDGRNVHFKPIDVTKKELTIVGSRMNAGKFPVVMEWLKNDQITPRVLITSKFPIDKIQTAFEYTSGHPENVKTLITFN